MNFPHATADQWNVAQRMIRGILSRHGITGASADDEVQEWTVRAMTAQHRNACPTTPMAAASGVRRLVARHGIGALTRASRSSRYRPQATQRIGLEQPQPDRDPVPVVNTAASSVDPATAAEIAEGYSPARAKAARRLGMTPSGYALAALGWGGLDDEDAAKASPSVPQCGPGYTPPGRGDNGSVGSTDPNPASRAASRLRCLNDWRRVAGLPPVR
jgi:hypothetical protein